jgi:6-phosphogluconolactonase
MPAPKNALAALASAAALLLATSCQSSSGQAARSPAITQFFAYYGTSATGPGKGISLGRFDSVTGVLSAPVLAAQAEGPSFLVLSADGRFLYACHEPAAEIAAYAVDRATGALRLLNKLPAGGADPCHISLDRTGRFALVANYTGGSVAVFSIRPDGSLGERTAFDQHDGKGPHSNQSSAHAHAILTDPSNRFALCADLGNDRIYIYRFDEKTGALAPINANGSATAPSSSYVTLAPGAGPRHLVFSPDGKFVYVTNELNATITGFYWKADAEGGQASDLLSEFQTISNLPTDFTGINSNAEIAISPNGKSLYASNRGHDAIAVFTIHPTGYLMPAQDVPTRGRTPRFFTFDPTGAWLIAQNQNSDTVAVFRADAATGRITPAGDLYPAPAPDCLVFLPAP